jgi:hypothetical protein
MGYCSSCGHFFSSSRDECPKCRVPLREKKLIYQKEKYPTQQINAGRIFFRSGAVVFRV